MTKPALRCLRRLSRFAAEGNAPCQRVPQGHVGWQSCFIRLSYSVVSIITLTAGGASAAFSTQNASESEYRQSRSSVIRRSGQMSRGAEPLGDASEPAVDTCLISAVASRKAPLSPDDYRSPVWNTGCPCGNGCCRPCRSKNTHPA